MLDPVQFNPTINLLF